jgi:hypothetical protein
MSKEIFVAFGVDIDAVGGWLGSYGGEVKPINDDGVRWATFDQIAVDFLHRSPRPGRQMPAAAT